LRFPGIDGTTSKARSFLRRLPNNFGKKSIISGKNDSQNKRLAPRIVLQCQNSIDSIDGFCFHGLRLAYQKSAFLFEDKIGLQ
jgi:hypothetical protein